MKNILNFGLKVGLAVAVVLAACVMEAPAQQGVLHKYRVVTNSLITVPTLVRSNLAVGQATIIDLTGGLGRGMAFQPSFAATNTATANVGFAFATSIDGTNYNTQDLLWYSTALNGTTGVWGWKSFSTADLDNVTKVKLLAITNGHASTLFFTNGWAGVFLDR